MNTHRKAYQPPTIFRQDAGFQNFQAGGESIAPCTEIAGVPVEDLVAEFGSPLFVFDEHALREKYRQANQAFTKRYPKFQFAWSYKTNYLRAICATFHDEGAIAEVVSDFEYEKARNLGIPGHNIIYNGPYKTRASLEIAVEEGAKIQVDNLDELLTLEEIAKQRGETVGIALRLYLDAGVRPIWNKFGFHADSEEAYQAIKRMYSGGHLKLIGLHTHIGTYILDPNAYRVSAQKLVSLSERVRKDFGCEIDYINLGGGFASPNPLHYQYLPVEQVVPSIDDYAAALVDGIYSQLPPDREPPQLYLETGRALVDEAGHMITSVVAVKQGSAHQLEVMPAGAGDKSMGMASAMVPGLAGYPNLIVDAGVNLLYTANWYRFNIRPAKPNPGTPVPTKIYGCLCMNIDVLREQAPLPHLTIGDRLVFHPVGAYNVTQSMQFISYRPRVVMVNRDGVAELIRDRDDLDYVEKLERLPEHLRLS